MDLGIAVLSSIRKMRTTGKVQRRVEAQKKLEELEENRKYFSSDKEYSKFKEHWEKQLKDNL